MTKQHIINAQISAGVWEGALTGVGNETPNVTVAHQGTELKEVTCTFDKVRGVWHIKALIPAQMINDGMQTFTVTDGSGLVIAHFSLLAGKALADDLRAEIELLGCELEILKSAFRKHCAEI
jgi:hypothetical protein